MRYDTVIWDFNGTILNDMQVGVDSVNVLLKERGLPLVKGIEDYRRRFHFPVIEYYRELGFDLEAEPYSKIADLWIKGYIERESTAGLQPYVLDLMDYFDSVGVSQVLLSATEKEMLDKQISSRGLKERFSAVYGKDDVYAYGKEELFRSVVKNRQGKCLLIGDTLHDAECADYAGCDVFLVSNGHNSRKILEGSGRPVFDDLRAIQRYFTDNQQ